MNSKIKTSVVLFGILEESSSNYRKLPIKSLGVLLVKENGKYVLPQCEMDRLIDLDEQSFLAVDKCTGLSNVYVEQLYTFSNIKDNQLQINPTYLGLISKRQMYEGLKNGCYWCELKINEKINEYECAVVNDEESFSFRVSKTLKEQTTDRYKFGEIDNGMLEYGIGIVLISAFERLRNKINYTDIVFNMMGETFTLKELQQVYEAIGNKKLLDAAFRRIIADKVEETNEILKGIGCRPSKIYKYKEKKYEKNRNESL
jgi:hypothetical protein